jgi:hypothetical protein
MMWKSRIKGVSLGTVSVYTFRCDHNIVSNMEVTSTPFYLYLLPHQTQEKQAITTQYLRQGICE